MLVSCDAVVRCWLNAVFGCGFDCMVIFVFGVAWCSALVAVGSNSICEVWLVFLAGFVGFEFDAGLCLILWVTWLLWLLWVWLFILADVLFGLFSLIARRAGALMVVYSGGMCLFDLVTCLVLCLLVVSVAMSDLLWWVYVASLRCG